MTRIHDNDKLYCSACWSEVGTELKVCPNCEELLDDEVKKRWWQR